jgi:hypothetical protein
MRLLTLSAIVGLAFAGQAFAGADQSNRTHHYRLGYWQPHAGWQIHIAQTQGRVWRDLTPSQKTAESASTKASSTTLAVPASCNSANAATPYCYTATQQSLYPPEGELFASAQATHAFTESRSETPGTPLSSRIVLGLAVLGALTSAK